MKVILPRLKKTEKIYLVSLEFFIMISILSSTFYFKCFEGIVFYIFIFVCLTVVLGNEFMISRTVKKELFGFFLCTILAFICLIVRTGSGSFILAASLIFVYCGRKYDFEKIGKHVLLVTVIIFIFIISSSKLGIITNYIFKQSTRVREGLGFLYALCPSTIMLNITALYCYLYRKQINIKSMLVLIICNIWIYLKTFSRSSLVLSLLIILIFLVEKILKKIRRSNKIKIKEKKIYKFLIPSYLIAAICSLYLTINYDASNPIYVVLNQFFGGRLGFGKKSIVTYGISLFPLQIFWYGNGLNSSGEVSRLVNNKEYNYVDCLYIQLLQHYGIIIFILYLIIITIFLYKAYKNFNYELLIILSIIALHCMIDDLQLYLQYNTFWLLIGSFLMNKQNNILIKKSNKKLVSEVMR